MTTILFSIVIAMGLAIFVLRIFSAKKHNQEIEKLLSSTREFNANVATLHAKLDNVEKRKEYLHAYKPPNVAMRRGDNLGGLEWLPSYRLSDPIHDRINFASSGRNRGRATYFRVSDRFRIWNEGFNETLSDESTDDWRNLISEGSWLAQVPSTTRQ